MGIEVTVGTDGIAEVVQNCPPVNALTVAEWFQLGDEIRRLGADRSVRAVILRSEGRGFNAGVDIDLISEAYRKHLPALVRSGRVSMHAIDV